MLANPPPMNVLSSRRAYDSDDDRIPDRTSREFEIVTLAPSVYAPPRPESTIVESSKRGFTPDPGR